MKTRVPLYSPGGPFLRVPEGPSNSLLGESVGEVHLSCHCDELEVSVNYYNYYSMMVRMSFDTWY